MILGAGLLVLVGLGLFIGGVLTGLALLYWACVAACLVASVLLVAARRPARPVAPSTADDHRGPGRAAPVAPTAAVDADTGHRSDTGEDARSDVQQWRYSRLERDDTATAGGGRGAHAAADTGSHVGPGEPGVEEVEVTDLLLVVDLTDDVLVVDEHPRYHLDGCRFLAGRETVSLPLDEARSDGFTPCALCAPDRHLAERERGRRARRGG